MLEILHPSVVAGVQDLSNYRQDPFQRARATLGYVLMTTFGNTEAATRVIEHVRGVHSCVSGTRPDGVPCRALDPELIAWVHTCIPWAVMRAYETYNRPLSVEEKSRYLTEQAPIGRMGGADWVPTTVAELDDYVERMRPQMAMTYQTAEFIGFLAGRVGEQAITRKERFDRWVGIRASMGLMPEWARHMTGTYQPSLAFRLAFAPSDRLKAKVVRWAYPELPCKALALARVGAGHAASAAA